MAAIDAIWLIGERKRCTGLVGTGLLADAVAGGQAVPGGQ